jgi:hypothetical protein
MSNKFRTHTNFPGFPYPARDRQAAAAAPPMGNMARTATRGTGLQPDASSWTIPGAGDHLSSAPGDTLTQWRRVFRGNTNGTTRKLGGRPANPNVQMFDGQPVARVPHPIVRTWER